MRPSAVGKLIGSAWAARLLLLFPLGFGGPERVEAAFFEPMQRPAAAGKIINYTATTSLSAGVACGLIAHDHFDGSIPHALGAGLVGGVVGGLLGYPYKYVLTDEAEKVVFPILHALLGSAVLGTTGFVLGWEYLDKPRGFDFPSKGFLFGGMGVLGGGIAGGITGFQLAVRF